MPSGPRSKHFMAAIWRGPGANKLSRNAFNVPPTGLSVHQRIVAAGGYVRLPERQPDTDFLETPQVIAMKVHALRHTDCRESDCPELREALYDYPITS